jgi:hypothetical protein
VYIQILPKSERKRKNPKSKTLLVINILDNRYSAYTIHESALEISLLGFKCLREFIYKM